jgi:hypothetical protein
MRTDVQYMPWFKAQSFLEETKAVDPSACPTKDVCRVCRVRTVDIVALAIASHQYQQSNPHGDASQMP